MTANKYKRLVRNMDEHPTLEGEEIEYAAEVITGGEAGVPDTVILVTDTRIVAGPMTGKRDESQLDFSISLGEIEQIQCEGMFADRIPLTTRSGTLQIPTSGLDPVKFTSAVVDHSPLTNACEEYGFGRTRFAVCKWATCLGAAMILVGIGFSVTMIGILVGLPLIGLGAILLLSAFAYKKAGDRVQDSVWSLPEPGSEAV